MIPGGRRGSGSSEDLQTQHRDKVRKIKGTAALFLLRFYLRSGIPDSERYSLNLFFAVLGRYRCFPILKSVEFDKIRKIQFYGEHTIVKIHNFWVKHNF